MAKDMSLIPEAVKWPFWKAFRERIPPVDAVLFNERELRIRYKIASQLHLAFAPQKEYFAGSKRGLVLTHFVTPGGFLDRKSHNAPWDERIRSLPTKIENPHGTEGTYVQNSDSMKNKSPSLAPEDCTGKYKTNFPETREQLNQPSATKDEENDAMREETTKPTAPTSRLKK